MPIGKLKEFLFKCSGQISLRLKIILHYAILGELGANDSNLWHNLDPDMRRPDLGQILK